MKILLKYKITLIFAFIFIFTFIGVYNYLNTSLTRYIYSRIKENLLNQIDLSKSYIEEVYKNDSGFKSIDHIADQIGKDLGVRVTIIDEKGIVLGDSFLDDEGLSKVENHLYRPEIQQALNDGVGESRRFSTTYQSNMIYVAKTFNHKVLEGVIRLSIPLIDIKVISSQLRKTLFLALFIALIIAIFTVFLASIYISKPIQEIAQATREIAGGDFSKKLFINSNDEIGDLANTFNSMSTQLNQRIEDFKINRSRLEAVLRSMTEGVMAVNLNSEIILMNQSLIDFFQVKGQVIGKRPIEVVRNVEIQEIVDKAIISKNNVESYEVTLLLSEERTALIHATSLLREKNIEGVVLVFHDITELRKLENIRKDFVANVSHELRTPVTSIKGYAETLINGAIHDKKNAVDFLKIIYKDSDRLARLIEDLLDLSKIESGKLKICLLTQELLPILQRVVSVLNMQLEEKAIKLKINFPKKIPLVSIDETAISQVFFNLIDNAIKYNHHGGQIIISAREEEKFIQIFVEDQGIGIPPEDIPRIFERFYRVDKAHSREIGGTGLGLSIVKHIVALHQGEVFAQSIPEQGSIFSFTLPKA